MTRKKAPCRSEIIRLVKLGLTDQEIADLRAVSLSTVRTTLSHARKLGELPPVHDQGVGKAFRMRSATYARLAAEATARGITAPNLCRRILDVVVADNLFRAVLGDEP
jgi:predicted transcriptional regulator